MAIAKRKVRPLKPEELAVEPALLLKLYRDMLLIRRFEEKAGQMYGMGLIGGFCHLYIGEEAVVIDHAVGPFRSARARQASMSSQRSIGWPSRGEWPAKSAPGAPHRAHLGAGCGSGNSSRSVSQ
jgi:hypothetical protein